MPPIWLRMVHYPCPILIGRGARLLSAMLRQVRQLLYAMRWVWIPEDQHLSIVPELQESVHVDGFVLMDHQLVYICDMCGSNFFIHAVHNEVC